MSEPSPVSSIRSGECTFSVSLLALTASESLSCSECNPEAIEHIGPRAGGVTEFLGFGSCSIGVVAAAGALSALEDAGWAVVMGISTGV